MKETIVRFKMPEAVCEALIEILRAENKDIDAFFIESAERHVLSRLPLLTKKTKSKAQD